MKIIINVKNMNMKNLFLIVFAFAILVGCGQSPEKLNVEEPKINLAQSIENAKVIIYYFHGKQRCPSCIAIQKVTEEAYNEFFADNNDVVFAEVDFSVKENEPLADKYEVAWSSLIIATSDDHINLTDAAFASASNNPDVLKELINNNVTNFLNN